MKIQIIRITIITICLSVIFYAAQSQFFAPPTTRAFGTLTVDFGVPIGTPLFTLNNLKPGDITTKTVTVTNSDTVPRMVAIKGLKTAGVGDSPLLESGLDLRIAQGVTPVYGSGSPTGPRTLAQFLTDSSAPNGIQLQVVPVGVSTPFELRVEFPASAGNPFQGKSLMVDLTFGSITGSAVIINEVFYRVDAAHGYDSGKDRGDRRHAARNDEWVELFNPTDQIIDLKNWKLEDNTGVPVIINQTWLLKPGEFVVVARSATIRSYWTTNLRRKIISLGQQIGDGLDNPGDHLILRQADNSEVDRVSWGSDTSGFIPPATNPQVAAGHSTARIVTGVDTDTAADWQDQNPATPGE